MWYIVLFPQENSVSAVPVSWYVEQTNECFWPPARIKKSEVDKLIKHKSLPEDDWKPHDAKILGRFSDYKEALVKLNKAKDKDKLSTTEGEEIGRGKRKKIQKCKNNYSSDSESNGNDSDVSVQFPKLPNFEHSDKNRVYGITKTCRNSFNNSDLDFNNQGEKSTDANAPKGKLFCRTRSRSLSPDNLNSVERRLWSNWSMMTDGDQYNQCDRTRKPVHSITLSSEPLVSTRNSPLCIYPEQQKESSVIENSEPTLRQILTKMQSDNAEFRVQVIRKLNLLNMKLIDLEDSFRKVQSNDIVSITENDNEAFVHLFPLNEDSLNNLEQKLDEEEVKRLIKYLSRVGGADVCEIVKRLMYKMFTNEVGSLFSWDGAKGKKKFKNLKLANIIIDTVRGNVNTKNTTEADIIVHIKKWLVRCKDRINLESKRRVNQTERNEQQ